MSYCMESHCNSNPLVYFCRRSSCINTLKEYLARLWVERDELLRGIAAAEPIIIPRLENISQKCSDTDFHELLRRQRLFNDRKAAAAHRRPNCTCRSHMIPHTDRRVRNLREIWRELQSLGEFVGAVQRTYERQVRARREGDGCVYS